MSTVRLADRSPSRVRARPRSALDVFWGRLDALMPFEYVAVLPALLATLAVIVLPLIFSFGVSFYHYLLTDPRNIYFAGLANYAQAFNDPSFFRSLWTTLIFAGGTVAAQCVLGMVFALVVHNLTFGQGIVRTAMLVPMFMTPAVVAFMWRFILHPDLGLMNVVTAALGFGKPVWLGDPKLALWSVMAVDIWRSTPFMFLIFLAGMQTLPAELYEAAAVDGASPWRRFTSVTLPLLKPLILVALITIALATYRYSFKAYNMGLGSAVSYIIFIVVFAFSLFFVRQMQRTQAE